MARSLDEIIEHEKPEVIQQAHEKAKEIIKDIDEKAEASAAGDKSDGWRWSRHKKLSHVKVVTVTDHCKFCNYNWGSVLRLFVCAYPSAGILDQLGIYQLPFLLME